MHKHPWSEMFRTWCAESGETQEQLAERIGVTQSVASAWASRTPTQLTATLDAVVGDSGSGGTIGMVPAPAAGDPCGA